MDGNGKLTTVVGCVLFIIFLVGFKLMTREAVRAAMDSTQEDSAAIPTVQAQVKPIVINPAPIQISNVGISGAKNPTPTQSSGVAVTSAKPKAEKTPVEVRLVGKNNHVLIRQWTAPSEAKFKPGDLLNPARVTDLIFHRDGDKLLTVSKAGVLVWDIETRKLLRTYKAFRDPALVSRDGRYVAIPSESAVTIFDVDAGHPTGTYTLDSKQILAQRWAMGGGSFSPSGECLLLGVSQVDNNHILVLSSATAAARKLKVPAPGRSDLHLQYEQLEPIPGSPNLLFHGSVVKSKSTITTLNTQTQKQTDLTSIPFKPWTLDPHRGMRASIDGRYVAAHDPENVVVVDRILDRTLFKLNVSRTDFSEPTFTPDGNRVVFVRHPRFYTFTIGGPRVYPSDTIELHEVKTGRKLGSLNTEEAGFTKDLTSVEVSHDGKRLAVAAGSRVAVFDFEAAFGLAPLPPKSLPAQAELYPVE